MTDHDPRRNAHRAIEAVWRIEAPRIIAALTRMVRDIGIAEELAQDALVAALERWPESSVPDNPGAWLMATAKHRAIDRLRRHQLQRRKHEQLGHELEGLEMDRPDSDRRLDDDIGDDLLRLVFTACHPVLSTDARVALTLRLLGGLGTDEIARAFLLPEATIAQRIVRAKRTLTTRQVPFEVPRKDQLPERLASVLGVIYLIFNEGYSATAGDDWMRPALCDEALRLGRVLVGLAPGEPEVHGLLALMEIQASRAKARLGPSGEPIVLLEQDRARWDRLAIGRGFASLELAERLGGEHGVYALQAAIAACHARAPTAADTDWVGIAGLYATLAVVAPSPVVELNRAVAVGMAHGPAAGLAVTDALDNEPLLAHYHLFPAVRGDLLWKLGRHDEARRQFEHAASLTRNQRERVLLLARAAACADPPGGDDQRDDVASTTGRVTIPPAPSRNTPMNANDPEYDPDDNFANSSRASAGIDPDADDTPEALVWQLLLLINPGDEESALQQFAEYREVLDEADPDQAEPIWLLKDVIDWKAGFYVDGADAVSFIDTITELAARWNLSVDWGVEDASDEDFLADADVPSLMAVAYDRLREYGYSLWTWNAGNGPSGDEGIQAGWITLSSDDEAIQELAHALDIELRPGSDPFG